MPALSDKEIQQFLNSGQHILKLATIGPDGAPYIVPVWYGWDGKAFTLVGRKQNRWIPYVQREPRVSILVDTCEIPYTRVTAPGRAEVVDANWFGNWEPISVKYAGREVGHKYYEDTKHIPRVLIKVTPGKFTTWTGGDWHPRYLK